MRLLLTFMIILASVFAQAEERVEDDLITASLLVAQPSDVLYSCVGHAFLRMECPQYNLDYCFSYEGEPIENHIFQFLSGKLKMGMFAVETSEFLQQYRRNGRGVRAYKLNLPLEVKRNLWRNLDEKVSEGIELPYDCVKQGCAISCKNLVENSLPPSEYIEYPEWPTHFEKTRGEILIDNMRDYPWNTFFLYSLGGEEAWKSVPMDEKLIIPEDLVSIWQKSKIGTETIIKDAPQEIVPWNDTPPNETLITPLCLSFIILGVVSLLCLMGYEWIKYVMLVMQGLLGVVLTYILLFSSLSNTGWSWLLVPFNPLPLLFLKNKRVSPIYSVILLVWLVAMILYPVKMIDCSYYVLCVAIIITLNTKLIKNFMKLEKIYTRLFLLFCLLFVAVSAEAFEDGYHWYKNKISAYPKGKGLVYAEQDYESARLPSSIEEYKDEFFLNKVEQAGSIDPVIAATAKPSEGYNFVGWYIKNEEDILDLSCGHYEAWKYMYGEEGYQRFLHRLDMDNWDPLSFEGIDRYLGYHYTDEKVENEEYEKECYALAPLNEIYGIFGKVNTDCLTDVVIVDGKVYEGEEDAILDIGGVSVGLLSSIRSIMELNYFLTLSYAQTQLSGSISKPANDIGDKITLSVGDYEGFLFRYWKDTKGNIYYDRDIELTVTEKETYTSYWTYVTYNYDYDADIPSTQYPITYVFEDADGVPHLETKLYDYMAKVPNPAVPEREGYTFVGWSPKVPAVMPATGIVTTAQWQVNQYTLAFDANGGSAVDTLTLDYGTEVTAPTAPTREGYTFVGWDKEMPSTMPAEDMTFTAQWQVNQYSLVFDTNDGTTIDTLIVDYGAELVVPVAPTREGYTFVGWDKEIPATMPAEDMIFTAQWQVNQYSLVFDTNDGTTIDTLIVDYGTEVTAPTAPTREGYTFVGWDKEIPATMPAEDMTFTAQWQVNQYTLVFDTNDGTTIDTLIVDYGAELVVPVAPTREGYTFVGWDKEIPATMPAADMTFTAQWQVNRYTIVFEDHDGEIISRQDYDYESVMILPDAPQHEGYTFEGWTPALPIDYVVKNDATYRAACTRNTYNVFYMVEDTVFYSAEVLYEDPIPACDILPVAAEGYEFKEWSSADSEVYEIMPAHDVIFLAKFSVIEGVDRFFENQYVDVYDLDGKSVLKACPRAGLKRYLKTGLYIIEGKKVHITK